MPFSCDGHSSDRCLIFVLIFPEKFLTLSNVRFGCAVLVRCSSSATLEAKYGILLCACFGIDGPHHIGESENLSEEHGSTLWQVEFKLSPCVQGPFPKWLAERERSLIYCILTRQQRCVKVAIYLYIYLQDMFCKSRGCISIAEMIRHPHLVIPSPEGSWLI